MSRMITRIVTTVPSPMYIGSPPQRGSPRRERRGRLVDFHLLGRPPLPRPDGPKRGTRLDAGLRENARVADERDRFRALLDATIALSSELSLDALLQKVA